MDTKVTLIISIISLVISGSSILISTIMTLWQIALSKKVHNIDLNKNEFDIIFNDYLIKIIPDKRKYLKFDTKGKLGIKDVIDMLHDLHKDSLYYRYKDKNFYDKLEQKIMELEDYLTIHYNKQSDSIRQIEILNKIDTLIEELYALIQNKKING